MNILIAHNFSDTSYAANTRALAIHLAAMGHEVFFFSHTPPDENPLPQKIRVVQWPESRPVGIASFRLIRKTIRDFKPDALLAHAAALNLAALAGWLQRVPFRIGYYHSAYEANLLDNDLSPFRQKLFRWRKAFFYRLFHRMVAVSQFAAADLHRWFGYPTNRIEVVYNALEDRLAESVVSDKIKNGPVRFFVPGRLHPCKNPLNLVKGFMAFARQFPGKAELVIAGDGPLRQELLHLASEHPDIRYAGTLPYSAMDQQMREAHWVVCSSLAEAFGMVNIEAMMNATPVIASAVGGIPEIVDNEKNGLLVFGDDEAKWASSFQKAVSLFEQQPSAYQQYRLAGREKFLLRFTRNQYLNAMTNLLVNARGL